MSWKRHKGWTLVEGTLNTAQCSVCGLQKRKVQLPLPPSGYRRRPLYEWFDRGGVQIIHNGKLMFTGTPRSCT